MINLKIYFIQFNLWAFLVPWKLEFLPCLLELCQFLWIHCWPQNRQSTKYQQVDAIAMHEHHLQIWQLHVHVLKQHSYIAILFLYFRVKNEMNVCFKGLSVIKTSTCTSICMCIISIILMIRQFFFFEIPYTYSFINTITNTSKCLKSSISKKNIIGIYCIKRQRLLLASASFNFNRHSMPYFLTTNT